jgi:hypothetical protein
MTRRPPPAPRYAPLFEHILSFRSYLEAEESLRRLDKLLHGFAAASDKDGVEYCRDIALQGRRRAEMITRNPRVDPVKRSQKREIALWFQIWLEDPELFWDWLELRKAAPGFAHPARNNAV